MDVAEILGMDMKNLAYDEQKSTLQEELEDDEIIDDNESRNELTQNIGLRADVKIASFAKADIFNPHVVNNEMANNNSPQFAEKKPCEVTNQFNLKTHMESNHGSKKLNKFGECWTCGKVLDNKLEFCIHTEKHKTCSVCGANLRNFTREEKPYTCKMSCYAGDKEKSFVDLCQYSGTSQRGLKNHRKKHHGTIIQKFLNNLM